MNTASRKIIQLTFTCSKSIMETPEECGNPANIYMFNVNDRNTEKDVRFSTVSIVDFEQVNVSWEIC